MPTRPEGTHLPSRESLQPLFAGLAWALGAVALLRRLNRPRALILTYHAFTPNGRDGLFPNPASLLISTVAFAAHLRYLERHYAVVPLSRMVDLIGSGRPIPEGMATLTMDDGYMSAYLHAFPLLKRHRMPATIFLATEFVDGRKPFWWDLVHYLLRATPRQRFDLELNGAKRTLYLETLRDRKNAGGILVNYLIGASEANRATTLERVAKTLGVDPETFPVEDPAIQPLTWTAIREMARDEIEFGSHTVTHTVLTRCEAGRLEWELVESRRVIERQLCQPCELFCYPNGRAGDWDTRTEAAVRKAGYRCAVTGIQGLVRAGDNTHALHRIPASANPLVFKTMASGANPSALAATFRSARAPRQR